jgi:hypothetical protein
MVAPVGMDSECAAPPLTSQKAVRLILPAKGAVLSFFGAGESSWRHSVGCLLILASKSCTPVQCGTRIRRLHLHIVTTIVDKCPSASVSVPQWAFGKPIASAVFGIRDQQLPPALAHVKRQFCLLLPAEERDDSLWSFHERDFAEPRRLLFAVSSFLLVIEAAVSEDTCCLTSDSTDVYTSIPINSFHSPMNVSLWTVVCMQFIPHWHCLLTLLRFHECNSELSSSRTVKLHTKCGTV